MKHVAFKDEKNNYFVLKKAKKESTQVSDGANDCHSSDDNLQYMNDEQVRKERRSSGKITSKQLRERTRENARSKSPILAEKKTISDSSDENAAKNAER